MKSLELNAAPKRSMGFSPAFAALGWRCLVALAAFHLVAMLCYSLPLELARTDSARDTLVYFQAAKRLLSGANLYQPWPDYGVQMTPSRFFYSPAFCLLLRPLASLDFLSFARVWTVAMHVAFWVYAFCLSRIASGKWDWKRAFVFALVADTLFQGHVALSIGQFEPFMWMLFGLALTTRSRAGLLALATLVKIHPIWSLCLALTQDKRAWKSAMLFSVPVLAASVWLVGVHNWAMWWPSTQPVASQGTFNPGNVSLSFVGLRLLNWAGLLKASGTLPGWAKAYLSFCAVGAPLLTAWMMRRRSPELRLAMVASAGVLFAPLCWTAYLPLLLLPVAGWLGERKSAVQGEIRA